MAALTASFLNVERRPPLLAGVRDLATDITPEEKASGFGLVEPATGISAVARELPGGLRAIKAETPDGRLVYAICDADLHALYLSATSLDDLRRRFG